MPAMLVVPDRNEWEIISDFLAACSQGALVVSPDMADAFRMKTGKDLAELAADEQYIEYDWGEEPDTVIDVVTAEGHYAMDALYVYAGLEPPEPT